MAEDLAEQVAILVALHREALQLLGNIVCTLKLPRNRQDLKDNPALLSALFTLADGWYQQFKEMDLPRPSRYRPIELEPPCPPCPPPAPSAAPPSS